MKPLAPPTTIVGPWADDQLARWALFGRALSGLFDLGTIVLTYALGRRAYGGAVGLLAAACVAFTVLHIQLSHFYAVDTLLTFFSLAALYCSFRIAQKTIQEDARQAGESNTNARATRWLVLCGLCYGLALATKITAVVLVVPIILACYDASGARLAFSWSRTFLREFWDAVRQLLLVILGTAIAVFVITQPYALIDWYAFGRDVIREALVARGWLDYPYTRQYAGTLPFIYSIVQSTVWGMGLPLGLAAWSGGALFIVQWWKTRDWRATLLLSFALAYFLTISLQYAKYLRYLLPLLPVLYILAACAWLRLLGSRQWVVRTAAALTLAAALLYATAFSTIYAGEHPWLTASRWIYENVPPGKTLMVEQWDDALPTLISFPGGARRGSDYTQIQFPMYDDDTPAKASALAAALAQSDYVILASQRLYGSIGRVAARYPLTTQYYEKLFNGELGFEPVMTVRNDPHLFGVTVRDDPRANLAFDASAIDEKFGQQYSCCPQGWAWNWGFADESFSVYDHPQPIIFKKTRVLTAEELLISLQ